MQPAAFVPLCLPPAGIRRDLPGASTYQTHMDTQLGEGLMDKILTQVTSGQNQPGDILRVPKDGLCAPRVAPWGSRGHGDGVSPSKPMQTLVQMQLGRKKKKKK